MFQMLRKILERRREEKAVSALTEQDLAELGMSRSQVLHFLRMPPDSSDRVVAMGRIFGLSEGALRRDHSQWLDLVETCGHCQNRENCAMVLSKGGLANPRDGAFCPNAETFRTMWKQS